MARIMPNRKYTIAENLKIHRSMNGIPTVWLGSVVMEQELEHELDNRLGIISFSNDYSFEAYIEYYKLFAELTASSNQTASNRCLSLLDLGYVPASIPPSFMAEDIREKVVEILTTLNIPYIEEEPMDYEGRRVDSPVKDIWVSRLLVSDILSMDIREVNIVSIVRRVLESESN